MRIALFQPDIPQNTGTLIRMAVCLGLPVDIIEPCGFIFDDKGLKRAGMDYLEKADLTRHVSWDEFLKNRAPGRLILCTTKSSTSYTDFTYHPDDIILMGRESCGAPEEVHQTVDGRVRIPMMPEERSLNIALSCAIVTGEAMRQTGLFRSLV